MELLPLLLIEALIPLALAMITFSANAAALLCDLLLLLFEVLGFLIERRRAIAEEDEVARAERLARQRRRRKWLLRVAAFFAALLLLLLGAALVANRYYFEPLTRWALRHVERKTGIAVEFERVSGSFWTGAFALENLSVRRADHPTSTFDLTVASATADVSLRDLARRRVVVHDLAIAGVTGAWTQTGRAAPIRPRRPFHIERLALDDVRITYEDRGPDRDAAEVALRIDTLRAEPLRGDALLFDLLLHSNAVGAVDDAAFELATFREDGRLYGAKWRCEALPVTLAARLAGSPFTWFDAGLVDVHVENHFDRRRDRDSDECLRMDWRLAFRDFHARVPPGSTVKARAAGAPLVAFVNRLSRPLDLAFRLQLKKGDSRFASYDDLRDMARRVIGEKAYETLGAFWKNHVAGDPASNVAEKADDDAGEGETGPVGPED